jgi:hypothetical protein
MGLVIAMLALLLLFSGAAAQGNPWYGGWLVVPNWTWQSPSPCWDGRCSVPRNHPLTRRSTKHAPLIS